MKILNQQKLVFNAEITKIIENYYNESFKILNTHIYRTINVSKIGNIEPFEVLNSGNMLQQLTPKVIYTFK